MKLSLIALLLWFSTPAARAQCMFDPLIQWADTLLCPETSTTLSTQSYQAYQWYARAFGSNDPAQPIPGATGQSVEVNAAQLPVYISVDATLNGCTERSPEILVDGWAFLPLGVLTLGDFTVNTNGNIVFCPGHAVYLVVQSPYTQNIQWYCNNQAIPNETNDSLLIGQSGYYNVVASTAECLSVSGKLPADIIVVQGGPGDCATEIAEIEPDLKAIIQINPEEKSLMVRCSGIGNHTLRLYNLAGMKLREFVFSNAISLNVNAMPAGFYFLTLESGNKRIIKKIRIP